MKSWNPAANGPHFGASEFQCAELIHVSLGLIAHQADMTVVELHHVSPPGKDFPGGFWWI